jgi:hypothetical protein
MAVGNLPTLSKLPSPKGNHVGLILLLTCLALHLANAASNTTTLSGDAFVGINEANQLILSPPLGGEIIISNFTRLQEMESKLGETISTLNIVVSELTKTRAELSEAKSQLSQSKGELSSQAASLLNVSNSNSELAQKLQANFSAYIAPINGSLYSTIGQLSETRSQVAQTESELSQTASLLNSSLTAMQIQTNNFSGQVASLNLVLSQTRSELAQEKVDNARTKLELNQTKSSLNDLLYAVQPLLSLNSISLVNLGNNLIQYETYYGKVLQNVTISNNSFLTSVLCAFLQSIGGSLTINYNPQLSNISFPLLQSVGGPVLISSNQVFLIVNFNLLNLTQLSLSSSFYYIIYSPNITCTALSPSNCRAGIVALGGDLGNSTLFPAWPSWSSNIIPAMSKMRFANPAAAYCRGTDSIYVAGGYEGSIGSTNSSERYDIKTNAWSPLAPMSQVRQWTSGLCLADGVTFMVFGGYYYFSPQYYLSSCEKLDTTSGIWSKAANMTRIRMTHSVVLYNSRPVVLGGWDSGFLNTAEQYELTNDTWSAFPSFKTGRERFGAAVIGTKIYIAGGNNGGPLLNSIEIFNGTTWTNLPTPLPSGGRRNHAVVSFQNKLVILGGNMTAVDVYDPSSGSWQQFPPFAVTSRSSEIVAVVLN